MSKQVSGARVHLCTSWYIIVRVHLFYVSASTLIYTPACTTTCTSILYLCINFERVYVSTSACTSTCVSILRFCINFERVLTCASTSFSTHTSLLKDGAWETFLKIMMHRVSFASQRMKRSFPVRQKYKYRACPPINAAHLESKLKRDNFSNQLPPRRAFQISDNFHTADEARRKVFIICSINYNFSNKPPLRTEPFKSARILNLRNHNGTFHTADEACRKVFIICSRNHSN